jgi:hypothetical protein
LIKKGSGACAPKKESCVGVSVEDPETCPNNNNNTTTTTTTTTPVKVCVCV